MRKYDRIYAPVGTYFKSVYKVFTPDDCFTDKVEPHDNVVLLTQEEYDKMQSTVDDNDIKKIGVAAGEPLDHITWLIPLLKQRRDLVNLLWQSNKPIETIMKDLNELNYQIRKILGL
jgi:hypothetical protein